MESLLDMIKRNPLIWILLFLAIVAPSFLFGTIRVLLIIIASIFVLMWILGLVLRYRMQKIQSDMFEKMNGTSQQQSSGFQREQQRAAQDDDMKIYQQRGTGEKKVSSEVGDYVEFEEVKEK